MSASTPVAGKATQSGSSKLNFEELRAGMQALLAVLNGKGKGGDEATFTSFYPIALTVRQNREVCAANGVRDIADIAADIRVVTKSGNIDLGALRLMTAVSTAVELGLDLETGLDVLTYAKKLLDRDSLPAWESKVKGEAPVVALAEWYESAVEASEEKAAAAKYHKEYGTAVQDAIEDLRKKFKGNPADFRGFVRDALERL